MAIYGKTFQEVRDGHKRGDFAPVTELAEKIQGMTWNQYKEASKEWGRTRFPFPGYFPRIYGKTFQEVRDGQAHHRVGVR